MFFILQIRMFTFDRAGEIHHSFEYLEVKKSLSLASALFICPVVAAESYDAAACPFPDEVRCEEQELPEQQAHS